MKITGTTLSLVQEALMTTLYTCPMHPEVRQTQPGSCPKCGMALEPLNAAGRRARTPSCTT